MNQPTVTLTFQTASGPSHFALDSQGQVIETVEEINGLPSWWSGSICDSRGPAGAVGVEILRMALTHGEVIAEHTGLKVERLP